MDVYLPLQQDCNLWHRNDVIMAYFRLGYSYVEIASFLTMFHDITISVRQICRILRSMGLRRRAPRVDLMRVVDAVESEISGPGATLGYRYISFLLI